MLLTILFFALNGLALLVAWSMTRMDRARVLNTLALLMRRQLPLEASLAELGRAGAGGHEQKLVQRLVVSMRRGSALPAALAETHVVSSRDAALLEAAHEYGRSERLLEQFADRLSHVEKHLTVPEFSIIYPCVVGLLIIATQLFLRIFIVPKFNQMSKEMEFTIEHFDAALALGFALSCALYVWGLLAWALQLPTLHRTLWQRFPVLGAHIRLSEQAFFARGLGDLLGGGATLERALSDLSRVTDTGALRVPARRVREALARGDSVDSAFSTSRAWRPELLWAIQSVAHGAPPESCLAATAEILDDKARAHLNRIHRICAPVALLISAAGVGLTGYAMFSGITAIARSFL